MIAGCWRLRVNNKKYLNKLTFAPHGGGYLCRVSVLMLYTDDTLGSKYEVFESNDDSCV